MSCVKISRNFLTARIGKLEISICWIEKESDNLSFLKQELLKAIGDGEKGK